MKQRYARYWFVVLGICSVATLPGCGGGGAFEVAEVRGRVTCNGEPIEGGQILLRPVVQEEDEPPGKSAKGHLDENGEFDMLTTYDLGDGAVVGEHEVQVIPEGYVVDEDEEDAPSVPPKIYPCIKRAGMTGYTVDIKSGQENVLEIELSSGG